MNSGINTCEGKITRVAMLTPRFVPTTTSKILMILLFHKSLKLSILPKLLMSCFLTLLNLASASPENHPAASNGWMMVRGATNPPMIADWILDPETIEPIKPIIMLITTNCTISPSIWIPFIQARKNITTNEIGIKAKMIFSQGIPPFLSISFSSL